MRLVAIAILFALSSASAQASDCPVMPEQTSQSLLLQVIQKHATAIETSKVAFQLAEACPGHSSVQLQTAEIALRAADEATDIPTFADFTFRAWDLLNRYQSLPPVRTQTAAAAHKLRKEAARFVLALDAQHQMTHEDLKTDQTFEACGRFSNSDSYAVETWYKEGNGGWTAIKFLERRAEPCREKSARIERTPFAKLASTKLFIAEHISDPATQITLLEEALASAQVYLKGGSHDGSWSLDDRLKAETLLAKLRMASAKE